MLYKVFNKHKLIILAVFLLFAFGLANLVYDKNNTVDLLGGQDWSHLPGAEITSAGIQIRPLGRLISHKDTSVGQPNPPVNVRGPQLRAAGDFEIKANITGIDSGASLQLYGQVPIIYDEWRQERQSIRFEVFNRQLKVRIWDGSSSSSIDERTYELPSTNAGTVGMRHVDDQIIILFNGTRLGHMPDHNIFSKGSVWFGTDANPGSEGWVLNSLSASSLDGQEIEVLPVGSLVAKNNDAASLRNLSDRHPRKLPIGVAVSIFPLFTDEVYRNIVLGQFSMITPENEFKPQSIHPQKDIYTFTDSDSLVEVAEKNNQQIHGHALVMPKANPKWMENFPVEKRKQLMVDYISTLVGRYKGKVAQWDVVNEPMSEDDIDNYNGNKGLRPQMWFDALGEQYIDIAFVAARKADPKAKLYLNDFGLAEDGPRWDALIALVKRLQARNVPIDGVGFESHVYDEKDSIKPEVLRRHIQELARLGIISRISEIDVLGDDENLQAKQYGDTLSVCLSEPACKSYGTWGVSDLYGSTTLSDRYPQHLGDSLLWDEDMKPKPAYTAIQDILKNQIR